jgi:hypothetical protein
MPAIFTPLLGIQSAEKRYTTLLGVGTLPHGVETPLQGVGTLLHGVKPCFMTPAARKRNAAAGVGLLLLGIGTLLGGIGKPCGMESERGGRGWSPCQMESERRCRIYGKILLLVYTTAQ